MKKKIIFFIVAFNLLITNVYAEEKEDNVDLFDASVEEQAVLNEENNNVALLNDEDKNYVVDVNGKKFLTFDEAMASAKEGDTLTLLGDINTAIKIDKAIVLDLNGKNVSNINTTAIVVRITNASNGAKLVIKNGKLSNNVSATHGGAIRIDMATTSDKMSIDVEMDNLTFTGNTGLNGGAVMISSGNVIITNSVIDENNSNGSGGAIHINATGSKSTCTLKNVKITNNKARGNGGAVAVSSSSKNYSANLIVDSDVVISKNTGVNGGGIWSSGSNTKVTIKDVELTYNVATASGGGAFFTEDATEENKDIIILSGTFKGNKAKTYGGAIYLKSAKLKRVFELGKDVVISENSAKFGGGIYFDSFTASGIDAKLDASIYDNAATSAGDDIYSTGKGNFKINIKLSETKENLYLANCNDLVDGWYDDSKDNRWNAHDLEKLYVEKIENELEGALAIKAAHGVYGKLIVNYVDEKGNLLSNEVTSTAKVGSEYTTKALEIENYVLKEVIGEEKGYYTTEDIKVTYVYKLKESGDIFEPVVDPEIPNTGVSVNNAIEVITLLNVSVLFGAIILKKKFC